MYLIGIDIGSSSIKVVLFNYSGEIVDISYRKTEPRIHEGNNRTREILWEPDTIWKNVAEGIKEIVNRVNKGTLIRAVAVSGFGSDGVPIDHEGNCLFPFISWHDTRTYEQLDEFKKITAGMDVYGVTGIRPWYYHTILRVMWMKRYRPDIYKKMFKWLVITDFINFKLTGAIATDYSEASTTLMFDQKGLCWSPGLFDAVGINSELFPQPRQSGTIIGNATEEAARITGLDRETLIVLGGHDNLLSSLATGASANNAFSAVTGTFESIMLPVDVPVITDAGMRFNLVCEKSIREGEYIVWGAQNAGMIVTWFKNELLQKSGKKNLTDAEMYGRIDALKGSMPGARGLFMLPDLIGSTTPIDDPKSRAAFIGIGEHTTIDDFIQAMIEGINFQSRRIINAIEQVAGKKVGRIINIGGASRSTFWMQNRADILGKQIEVPEIEEATALGAAMIAGVGIGEYKNYKHAYERTRKKSKLFDPDPQKHERYSRLFSDIFEKMYGATSEINHSICELF